MRFPYSYKKVHEVLRRLYGPAREHTCRCGESAEEWAYQFTGETIRNEDGSRPHSANPDDYAPMCRSCHGKFDAEHDPAMNERKTSSAQVNLQAAHAKWGDPEYRDKMSDVLHQNSLAIAERRKTDPAFDAHMKRGGNGRTERMKDPEFAAQVTDTLTRNARVRVRCNICGKESNRAGMGNHRRFSGHSDWVYVNDEEQA